MFYSSSHKGRFNLKADTSEQCCPLILVATSFMKHARSWQPEKPTHRFFFPVFSSLSLFPGASVTLNFTSKCRSRLRCKVGNGCRNFSKLFCHCPIDSSDALTPVTLGLSWQIDCVWKVEFFYSLVTPRSQNWTRNRFGSVAKMLTRIKNLHAMWFSNNCFFAVEKRMTWGPIWQLKKLKTILHFNKLR